MKPLVHARLSATRYGGEAQEYLKVHDLPDLTKAHFAAMSHRLLFHSEFGIELATRIVGERYSVQSTGHALDTRDLLTDHIVEDLGTVSPLRDWMKHLDTKTIRLRPCPRAYQGLRDDALAGAVARWGGARTDYEALVQFFDWPMHFGVESELGLWVLHNSLGIYLAEMAFGVTIPLSSGKQLCVRTFGEVLVQARTGYIPSFGAIASNIRIRPWMNGQRVAAGLAQRKRHLQSKGLS